MHKNLLNLLLRNARRGEFRAEGNAIYLYDVIVSTRAEAEYFGGVAAEDFVTALGGMEGDVSLRINSPGGDVFAARAMAQAIREHKGKVVAHVDGVAASATSFLTSAADETIMAQGAMLMIHKAWSLQIGNADDFMATAALLEKIDGTIAESYVAAANRRGIDAADFAALMKAETWFTGSEAVEVGLADRVTNDEPKVSARWDLSAYGNVPATSAEHSGNEAEPKAQHREGANDEFGRRMRLAALRLRKAA